MTLNASDRICSPPLATWRGNMLICGAFVLAVLGAKLWIIARFAGPTPLNDEWDVHALGLFAPLMDSALSLRDLLAPHNEHRILTTRLVALGVLAANGSWDPIAEMIVNAAIHVALGVCILAILGRRLGSAAFAVLVVATAVLLSVPNASETPTWGIETHFYAVLLFGFATVQTRLGSRRCCPIRRYGEFFRRIFRTGLRALPPRIVCAARATRCCARGCGSASRGYC